MAVLYAKTQTAIAKELGVKRQAVAQWMKHAAFPAKGPDGYDVQAIRKWRDRHQQRRRITAPAPETAKAQEKAPAPAQEKLDVPPLEISRARKEAAQAEIEETKLARLRRELIPMDAVEKEWSTILARGRQRITDITTKILSQYHPKMKRSDLEKALNACVDETLAELATPPDYQDPEDQ